MLMWYIWYSIKYICLAMRFFTIAHYAIHKIQSQTDEQLLNMSPMVILFM